MIATLKRYRLGLIRALIAAALACGMLWIWTIYREADSLHTAFGRPMGDVLPIYANARAFDLSLIDGATTRLWLAIGTMLAGVGVVGLSVVRRWPTVICVALGVIATFGINVMVNRIPRGHTDLIAPFLRQGLEYFPDTQFVKDKPLKFIADYPMLNRRRYLAVHPGTHPPGGVLFLYYAAKWFGPAAAPPSTGDALQRLIFGGADSSDDWSRGVDAAAWATIAVTSLAIIPAFVLAHVVGGAAVARRLLPLYLVTPNLVLFGATCMDGVFLTASLSAMAAGFVAMQRWSIVGSILWSILAGLFMWLASFMTFSSVAVPILMVLYALAITVRRPGVGLRMLARAAVVGVVTFLAQLAAERWLGYDVRATLDRAMRRDLAAVGWAGDESYEVWRNLSLGNFLAFTFGSGLVVAALFFVSLFTWRLPRRTRAFSIAFSLCILGLAMSTWFSMEVERVWLFLTPAGLIVAARSLRGGVAWLAVLALAAVQTIYSEWYFNTWW